MDQSNSSEKDELVNDAMATIFTLKNMRTWEVEREMVKKQLISQLKEDPPVGLYVHLMEANNKQRVLFLNGQEQDAAAALATVYLKCMARDAKERGLRVSLFRVRRKRINEKLALIKKLMAKSENIDTKIKQLENFKEFLAGRTKKSDSRDLACHLPQIFKVYEQTMDIPSP